MTTETLTPYQQETLDLIGEDGARSYTREELMRSGHDAHITEAETVDVVTMLDAICCAVEGA